MITGSFNGWNIIALPAMPSFSQVDLTMQDSVAAGISPFTRQSQVLDWGADWWEATATLPPMSQATADAWIAFLAETRGIGACFYIGNPLKMYPSGPARGIPVVHGSNAARSQTLAVRGMAENQFRVLLPGDFVQIGHRLHMNLDSANTDSGGFMTLNLWPRLRETANDGDPVILRNPRGLFRFADNKRSHSISMSKTITISLSLVEAL